MENSNRNDVVNFFKDMPPKMQIQTINKMQQQIKKPPDLSFENTSEIKSNSKELTEATDIDVGH